MATTIISQQQTSQKTKKNKIGNTKKKTKDLWNKFNSMKDENNDDEINNSKLECLYNTDLQCKLRETCDLCESGLRITEEGFYTCENSNCGVIYKDYIDDSAEWRYYGANDNQASDPTRCGMPINPLLKESSYGCKIICNGKSSYEMRKIRRYTEWQSMPYKEKAQYDEFLRIKTMANNSGIPKYIIDDALIYHKKISEEKTFRALNRDGIIAASIYISGRVNNFPRTAKEIAAVFHLDHTSATKGCKNALTILNKMEKDMVHSDKTSLCQTKPISFIERYCSKLNINSELTKLCQFIAVKIEKNNIIPENTPHSVAAGIVYFVGQMCSLNISKKDVRGISEISEVTITKCYKKLEKIQEQLVPKMILDKYC
jgi:transcription initiation factor TFIIB